MSILCSMVGATFSVAAAAEIIRAKKGIQAVGNAQISTAQSKFSGASALFDGTGDYLTVNFHTNTDFEFTAGEDFTIECFVRVTTYSQFNGLISLGSARSGNEYTLYIEGISGAYYATAANFGGSNLSRGTTNLSTGTWHHLAVSRSGTTVRLFVNGALEDTDTLTFTAGQQSTIKIGSFSDGSLALNGYLDEIRISNTARYTSAFTPTTTPFVNDTNTLLLIHANGTNASTFFEDDNGIRGQIGITPSGNAQISTAASKFNGSSYLGDGTGDFLNVGDTGDFAFGTGNFTIEGWIYNTKASSTRKTGIVSKRNFDNINAGGWGLYVITSTGRIGWENLFSGGTVYESANSTIAANTWYHFAVVRNGSGSNNVTIYVDGVSKVTFTSTTDYTNVNQLKIGTFHDSTNNNVPTDSVVWQGYIDEIRISNSARYTGNFTAPSAPFVNDTNTLLLMHMNGSNTTTVFRDDNGSTRSPINITTVGNAAVSTTQSKFGGSSVYFNGTNGGSANYLNGFWNDATIQTITNMPNYTNYTVEFWLYVPSSPGFTNLQDGDTPASVCIGLQNPTDYPFAWSFGVLNNATVRFAYLYNSSYANYGQITSSNTLASNTWYHLAFVKTGSGIKIYIDGTERASGTLTGTMWIQNHGLSMGSYYRARPNIWMDEIRISSTNRYTANFTAPTAPFQADANTLLLIHGDGTNSSTAIFDDNGRIPT